MKGLQKQNPTLQISRKWPAKLPLFILLFFLIPFAAFS